MHYIRKHYYEVLEFLLLRTIESEVVFKNSTRRKTRTGFVGYQVNCYLLLLYQARFFF